MAAVQGLLKKHDAFETDISVHGDRFTDICEAGQQLIDERNHHADSIAQRCEQLINKMYNMEELANVRKTNLLDNSAYLQFMWKADVVESWMADKETDVRSDEFSRDLSSVQTLLTKQETFYIGLRAFETEGIQNISSLKEQLISGNHVQAPAINKKFSEVIARWNRLLSDSSGREQRLLAVQNQFRQIEELYLTLPRKPLLSTLGLKMRKMWCNKNLLVSVQHRREKVVSKSAERTRALDYGYKEAREFHDAWDFMIGWLNDGMIRLDNMSKKVRNDPEKIKQQIVRHKEFQKELEEKRPMYDSTMKTEKDLINKAPKPNEPAIKNIMTELKNKWSNLCNLFVEKLKNLEEALLFSG